MEVPEIDQFGSTNDRKIKVWSTSRFLASLDMVAKIDLPLDATWRLLTHEDGAKVFRSVKVCSYVILFDAMPWAGQCEVPATRDPRLWVGSAITAGLHIFTKWRFNMLWIKLGRML